MLLEGGIINRRGTIEDKNTVSDYREIEIERGNSVFQQLCTLNSMVKNKYYRHSALTILLVKYSCSYSK